MLSVCCCSVSASQTIKQVSVGTTEECDDGTSAGVTWGSLLFILSALRRQINTRRKPVFVSDGLLAAAQNSLIYILCRFKKCHERVFNVYLPAPVWTISHSSVTQHNNSLLFGRRKRRGLSFFLTERFVGLNFSDKTSLFQQQIIITTSLSVAICFLNESILPGRGWNYPISCCYQTKNSECSSLSQFWF